MFKDCQAHNEQSRSPGDPLGFSQVQTKNEDARWEEGGEAVLCSVAVKILAASACIS